MIHLNAQGLEDRLNAAIATIREARSRVIELEAEVAKLRAEINQPEALDA